ncbi:hypothetical protein OIU79_025686 [Salix purpurea]|uniref:Protein kinase domain-containing protein n=1 Tax=Salix purpurea TaxID=77065 RepID=A0A9Q1A765_SALPP|nr:hypothetical protein OIU79_025686 [Salix purpurea]
MTCQNNVVTELRIAGDKPAKVNNFVGFAIPNQTLSGSFSLDSFVTTLARLTSLRVLSLVSLGIWGSPSRQNSQISTMVNLQTLNLDNNFFNGTVPNWFDSLSNLTILSIKNNQLKDLSGNSLDSDLPSMPKGLVMAFLSNNSLSGEIPRQYSQLSQLQYFDISFNKLSGKLPASLLSLPNISHLNLASNMLTGSLPHHLNCGSKLQFVDISNNRLTGGLPYCLSTESGNGVVKFGGNCLSVDLHHQRAESSCVPVKRKPSGEKNIAVLVGVIAGVFVIIALLACGLLMVCKICCPRGISEQHLLHKAKQEKSVTGFSSGILSNARYISEAENWGDGSHGMLYKGTLENGTQVAIRCIPSSKKYSMRNLKLRLDLLAKLRHPHLVCLLGHCIDGGEQDYTVNKVFLVYECVSNGNFRAYLSEDIPGKVLNWSERLAVLISVAKAIHFLHTGVIPGFFNNRLKANNILLNEYGIAKLSDYGLSIVSEAAGNCGENGEGPKSWQMERLEDDVCSFGFILLESLIGPSVSAGRDKFLLDELASCSSQEGRQKLLNPIVLATCSQESLSIVITITNKCICSESWSRPSFEDILWNLQYAVQVQGTEGGEQHR